jgi:ADP-ribose pyrophosphatase
MADEREWETLRSEVAWSGRAIDVVVDHVRLPGGAELSYEYVNEPDGVVVLPVTDAGNVVMINEWRQTVGRVDLALPGGSLSGDNPEAAARRELEEETGYVSGSLSHLITVEPTNGTTDGVHHHFVAEGCRPEGTQRLDQTETIDTIELPIEEVRDAVQSNRIRDGKTVTAVLYHRLEDRDTSFSRPLG